MLQFILVSRCYKEQLQQVSVEKVLAEAEGAEGRGAVGETESEELVMQREDILRGRKRRKFQHYKDFIAHSQDVIETVEREDLLLIKTTNQSEDEAGIKRTKNGTREIPPQVRRGKGRSYTRDSSIREDVTEQVWLTDRARQWGRPEDGSSHDQCLCYVR